MGAFSSFQRGRRRARPKAPGAGCTPSLRSIVDVAARQWMPAVAAVTLVALVSLRAWGTNSVAIESKTVNAGATGVTVGISISNDVTLSGILLPLEIRAVDPGSFVASSLTVTAQGRVAASGLMDVSGTYYFPTPAPSNTCSGPISHTFTTAGVLDYVSPDGVLWCGIAITNPCLGIGTDGGTPSILLSFSVTSSLGDFEIDTCCMTPTSHLSFADCSAQNATPSFTRGVVTIGPATVGYKIPRRSINSGGLPATSTNYGGRGTIGQFAVRPASSSNYSADPGFWATVLAARGACSCPCHGDPQCDGVHNVQDVVQTVNVAFRGYAPVFDPQCPKQRTDVNCDGVSTVQDVVKVVNVAFRGGNPLTEFCDPCAP